MCRPDNSRMYCGLSIKREDAALRTSKSKTNNLRLMWKLKQDNGTDVMLVHCSMDSHVVGITIKHDSLTLIETRGCIGGGGAPEFRSFHSRHRCTVDLCHFLLAAVV